MKKGKIWILQGPRGQMRTFRLIAKPNRYSAGKASINCKIHHYVYSPKHKRKMWVYCGDCNNDV